MINKDKLFKHQKKIGRLIADATNGWVMGATGTGKTLIQAECVRILVEVDKFGIIKVSCPRIALAMQLNGVISLYLQVNGFAQGEHYEMCMLHSGKAEYDAEALAKHEAAGQGEEVELEKYELIKERMVDAESRIDLIKSGQLFRAQIKNIPFICITTFHSEHKLFDLIVQDGLQADFKLGLNDECQYLTQKGFNENFKHAGNCPEKCFGFTASAVYSASDDGLGMNNIDNFGECIASISIAEAIESGMILGIEPFRLLADIPNLHENRDRSVVQFVEKAFETLFEYNKEIAPKLLVAVQNRSQIMNMILWLRQEGLDLLADIAGRPVKVITVHSKDGHTTEDGQVVDRSVFDQKKDEYGRDLDLPMIIMHYDILSEGIDIQGLNGCLILRQMGEGKFAQTIGRIVRIIWNPDGTPNFKLKKKGLLMVPDISSDDRDAAANFSDILLKMKQAGYITHDTMAELRPEAPDLDDIIENNEGHLRRNEVLMGLYAEELELKSAATFNTAAL